MVKSNAADLPVLNLNSKLADLLRMTAETGQWDTVRLINLTAILPLEIQGLKDIYADL